MSLVLPKRTTVTPIMWFIFYQEHLKPICDASFTQLYK